MKKLATLLATATAAVLVALAPASAANAWGTWGTIPVQWQGTKNLPVGSTTVPYAFDSAFKPYTVMVGATTSALDVEWDFFYSTFAGGYGACTTNATPGAYDCPGGITVQVTQPVGDPYVVASVALVDRTDWTAWNVTPFDKNTTRAAAVVVSWTSAAPATFADTLTEVHFAADSINLPSDADQALANDLFFKGAVNFFGAGGFETNRQGFTQYTGGGMTFESASTSGGKKKTDSGSALANTGPTPMANFALAGTLLALGLLMRRFASVRAVLKKR